MINNIQIKNYKSIRSLDLNMRPVNILIGSNGSGKSNFIGFFKFLKNIYDRNLQNYIAEEGSCDDFLYFSSKVSGFIWSKIEFSHENGVAFAYEFELKPNSDNRFYFKDEYAILHEKTIPIKEKIGWGGQTESRLAYQKSSIGEIIFHDMDSFRIFHLHDTGKTSKLRKPAQLNDNEHLREDGSNLPAFLYWMQKKYPKEFKKIEMTIHSVAPFS